jgi:hypothetical protein
VKLTRVSVKTSQTRSHIGYSNTVADLFLVDRQPRPVVINAHSQRAIGTRGSNTNGASLGPFGDSVLNGVFHDRLKYKTWHLRGEKFSGDIHAHLKAIGESCLLYLQVFFKKLDLFPERNLLLTGTLEHPP